MRHWVSILTRPEGRVQPIFGHLLLNGSLFQSSPVPKDGCNARERYPTNQCGFNPHPSRRTGATGEASVPSACVSGFQSSPVPKDGCNKIVSRRRKAVSFVSILTRPEGRVQQNAATVLLGTRLSFNPHPSRRTGATGVSDLDTYATYVSILTRPEGRVQPQGRCCSRQRPYVSILTRPEGRVQLASRGVQ